LSDNANQLALFCTVLVLLSLHLAEVASRFDGTIVALICMIVAIVVGRLTMSDSFLLVLVLAGPIFVALKLRKWLMSVERRMLLRSASAWILVLALPLVVAYVTPLGATVAAEVEESIKSMTKGGGGRDTEETTRLRIELWGGAIRRGVDAGMLGLGPGPHLEIPPAIVAGRLDPTNDPNHVAHPEFGHIPNFEAHNTFLDLFVQGGLIAVLSIGWLGATALSVTRRAGLDALTTSICGLAVFGIFHLIVRHPIVWFAISLSLVAAANPCRASKRNVES
jgi:O-antigen ligase